MWLGKRIFDIFFAFIGLVLLSPLFLIVSIWIKSSSKGTVFFNQKRVGLHEKPFYIYKFRTMYFNTTSNAYTPINKDDNRITKVGEFLRKTNLDELPQIFNVLLGHMSIVGPRPHALAFHQKYSTFIEYINDRQNVKPGITGWAQINGLRGDLIDFEENKKRTIKRVRYDLAYIQKWSYFFDLYIIYVTFKQMVLRKTNAH